MKEKGKQKKVSNRSILMQFKVNCDEKAIIDESVSQFSGSTSEYLRSKVLRPEKSLTGKEKQLLAHILCQHAQLVNQLNNADLQNQFTKMEEDLWLFIK